MNSASDLAEKTPLGWPVYSNRCRPALSLFCFFGGADVALDYTCALLSAPPKNKKLLRVGSTVYSQATPTGFVSLLPKVLAILLAGKQVPGAPDEPLWTTMVRF